MGNVSRHRVGAGAADVIGCYSWSESSNVSRTARTLVPFKW